MSIKAKIKKPSSICREMSKSDSKDNPAKKDKRMNVI
jgi:hypothetical protein